MQQDVVKLQKEVGFFELLKNNPTFRRLWMGLAISLLGEWVQHSRIICSDLHTHRI